MKNNPMELRKLIFLLHRQFSQSVKELNPIAAHVRFLEYVVLMMYDFVTAVKVALFS
jgi:hypothetical protein